MTVRKVATLLCGGVLVTTLVTGCGGDNVSTETNLATNIPMPKPITSSKTQHARHSNFRGAKHTSPHLLPNGMPG